MKAVLKVSLLTVPFGMLLLSGFFLAHAWPLLIRTPMGADVFVWLLALVVFHQVNLFWCALSVLYIWGKTSWD